MLTHSELWFAFNLRAEQEWRISIVCPTDYYIEYIGEVIKEGETSDLNDISVTLYDYKGSLVETEIDVSKLKLMLFYDYGLEGKNKFEYNVPYDYTFTDNEGNELYICICSMYLYIPYE